MTVKLLSLVATWNVILSSPDIIVSTEPVAPCVSTPQDTQNLPIYTPSERVSAFGYIAQ